VHVADDGHLRFSPRSLADLSFDTLTGGPCNSTSEVLQ
jgi:hypothetical protein